MHSMLRNFEIFSCLTLEMMYW